MEKCRGGVQGEDGWAEEGVDRWYCDDEKWDALGEDVPDGEASWEGSFFCCEEVGRGYILSIWEGDQGAQEMPCQKGDITRMIYCIFYYLLFLFVLCIMWNDGDDGDDRQEQEVE